MSKFATVHVSRASGIGTPEVRLPLFTAWSLGIDLTGPERAVHTFTGTTVYVGNGRIVTVQAEGENEFMEQTEAPVYTDDHARSMQAAQASLSRMHEDSANLRDVVDANMLNGWPLTMVQCRRMAAELTRARDLDTLHPSRAGNTPHGRFTARMGA